MATNGNGTTRRVVGITPEIHERLLRLSALHGKSQAWLIDTFTSVYESRWKSRLSPEQWSRYFARDLRPSEARAIMERFDFGDDDDKPRVPEPFVFDNA